MKPIALPKPLAPPALPICLCLGPRRWGEARRCGGVPWCEAVRAGRFRDDNRVGGCYVHFHYRCGNPGCGREVASAHVHE